MTESIHVTRMHAFVGYALDEEDKVEYFTEKAKTAKRKGQDWFFVYDCSVAMTALSAAEKHWLIAIVELLNWVREDDDQD